ncbi:MAG: hypothetical protein M3Z26_04600 [Bacteroidota bacterium]|nr:hypothetical protein [Bacteroidota bacterium]
MTYLKYYFTFFILLVMGNRIYAQKTLQFSQHGLNLIEMGVKLDSSIKNDLHDIDRSTGAGDIRYISLSLENKDLIYKELSFDNYITKDIGTVENIYLGFTKDNEVKRITIVYSRNSIIQVKDILDSIFKEPKVQVQTTLNSNSAFGSTSYSSYYWSGNFGFYVNLSLVTSEIIFWFLPN